MRCARLARASGLVAIAALPWCASAWAAAHTVDGLDVAGPWRLLAIVSALGFGAILALLLYFTGRSPRAKARPSGRSSSGLGVPAAGGTMRKLVVAVLLTTLLGSAGLLVLQATSPRGQDSGLTVEITAHQWRWDVRYLDRDGARAVRGAGELHLPAGRPVAVELRSADVVHSLLVPGLALPQAIVPGRVIRMRLQVERPGVHEGQCAEACGDPHTNMVLVVVVHAPESFDAWLRTRSLDEEAPR